MFKKYFHNYTSIITALAIVLKDIHSVSHHITGLRLYDFATYNNIALRGFLFFILSRTNPR